MSEDRIEALFLERARLRSLGAPSQMYRATSTGFNPITFEPGPESNPILGGNEMQGFPQPTADDAMQERAPLNEVGGRMSDLATNALQLLGDDFGAAYQQFRIGEVENRIEDGSLQPVNYQMAVIDNPTVPLGDYYDAASGTFSGVPSDDYILHQGQLYPRVITDAQTGEEIDLSEDNQLINFGRALMGGMLDPIDVPLPTIARGVARFVKGGAPDPTVMNMGLGSTTIDTAKETDLRRVLEIKAEEMQVKPDQRTQPSGDQMFDVSPESYAAGVRESDQIETPVPRAKPGAKLPKKQRLQLVVDNMDAIADRLAERARPHVGTNVQYFYHLGPLVDKAAELGIPEAQAREAIEEFAALYGATSPRTRTEPNLRSATLVRAKEKQGIDYDEIVGPGGSGINEAGYPMMINPPVPGKAAGIHKLLIDRLRETGEIDYRTNPKPATFVENVKGNLQGVTVDTHAIRGALYALNEIAPGSLTRQWFKNDAAYQRYLDDPSDIANYSGDDVADTLEGQMVDGVKQQTEYAVLSDLYKKVAERLGVMPAEAQSLSWFANGDITGLGSAPKSIVELINERIDVTAQATGETKDTIFRGFIEGKIPLLSASGVLIGAGMLGVGQPAEAGEVNDGN
jgi:hypothetical protein